MPIQSLDYKKAIKHFPRLNTMTQQDNREISSANSKDYLLTFMLFQICMLLNFFLKLKTKLKCRFFQTENKNNFFFRSFFFSHGSL